MRIVLAPDKFKGSLSAAAVAAAVADGIRSVAPDTVTVQLPVADGGDGTVAAAVAAGYQRRSVDVAGPTGEPVRAPYAVSGGRAVVELAAACGLDLLPQGRLDALGSSTFGLGQVIAAAIDGGARQVVVGLGGSASNDGGAGMVQALGGRLTDASGNEIDRGGAALADLHTLDLGGLRRRVDGVEFVVASDVDNPLLGPNGAVAVFGEQKGVDPAARVALDAALARWADAVRDATGADLSGQPGAGAAGGAGFAAIAVLGARLRPGIELVLDLLDFDTAVRGADLVVTGEGSLDDQSLAGKAPVGVASAAARAGVTTVAVAGRSRLAAPRLREAGIAAVYPLSDIEPDPMVSIANAASLLRTVGQRIAADWIH